jgi:hypothetical protein
LVFPTRFELISAEPESANLPKHYLSFSIGVATGMTKKASKQNPLDALYLMGQKQT